MQKIKDLMTRKTTEHLLTGLIIFLVGLTSFGLGRISKDSSHDLEIGYTEPVYKEPNKSRAIQSVTENKGSVKGVVSEKPKIYYASSRGSKYYYVGCSGGKSLKEENKIYFDTKEDAEQAGYELSSTCK